MINETCRRRQYPIFHLILHGIYKFEGLPNTSDIYKAPASSELHQIETMKSTGMLRLVSLTIFIDITLSVVLEDTQNFEINSTSFNASLYPPVEGDLRFGGSSSLFFLHLLKHKLHKLNQLQRIQTTTASNPGCLCVPYYLCDINNNIILTGSLGTLDLRYVF